MRRAVDTNVIVRLLVRDDRVQSDKVVDLMSSDTFVILNTVLLETEWVLRGAYSYDRDAILRCFDELLALDVVEFADLRLVLKAVDLFKRGMDFADAVHLIGSADLDGFATFDKDLARRAGRAGVEPPVTLL